MNAKENQAVTTNSRRKPRRLVYCGDERYVLNRSDRSGNVEAVNAASWMPGALDRLKALEHHKRKEVRHGG